MLLSGDDYREHILITGVMAREHIMLLLFFGRRFKLSASF